MSVFLSCLQAESAINPCPFRWTARRTALGQMPVSRVSAARWSIKSVCRYLGPALNHLQPEWSPSRNLLGRHGERLIGSIYTRTPQSNSPTTRGDRVKQIAGRLTGVGAKGGVRPLPFPLTQG